MSLETEIKFTVSDKETLNRLASLDSIGGYTVIEKGLKPHVDTYFDTRDKQLFKGMAVLRLREKNGARVLTFKSKAPSHVHASDTLHRRTEIESPTSAAAEDIIKKCIGDLPPVKALHDMFGDLSLTVSLTASNQRRVFHLTHEENVLFELVLDDVLFSGHRGERRVYELEIESTSGCEEELRRLEKLLRERFGLKPAGPSKYILGMELVG